MKKIKYFKLFLESSWNPSSLSESDPIDFLLDLYNKVGYEGMLEPEIEFMKSGGKKGANLRYHLRPELQKSLAQLIDLLMKKDILYELESTWMGNLGWFWFLVVEHKDSNLFSQIKSLYPDPDTDPEQKRLFTYVQLYSGPIQVKDFSKEGSGKSYDPILVYLVDLSWYSDINKNTGTDNSDTSVS